ncbi:MAG: hypothetical protein WC441_01435 [Patescibacteria group bacterium]
MKKVIIHDEGLKTFVARNLVGEYKKTTFPYQVPNQRKTIAMALTFWRYLRKLNYSDVQKRREKITSLMKTENELMVHPLIKIVAMIETLPDSVWRKLLWEENIDLDSFEACLRRLDDKQVAAITDNYANLFGHWDMEEHPHSPQLPPVCKKGLRNRLKVFFGIITSKKLLQEPYQREKRYQSKGAWAFNLLGLDFGFSLYPKGENNDSKIINKSFTRFLSIKEHINDFVVNQEDGKYWWLYRTARSNYAFWPNKEIKLKSHVCPGFWVTFLTHLAFWVISPLGLISAILWMVQSQGSYVALFPLIASLPLIAWIIIAGCRLIVKGIEMLPKKLQIIPQTIGIIALAALVLLVIGVIIYGIGIVIHALAPIVGSILAVMLTLTFCFYIGFFFVAIAGDSGHNYSDTPKTIRFLLHFSLIAAAVVIFDKYLAAAAIAGIIAFAQGIWDWYTSDLLLSNWFLLMLLFTAGFAFFYRLFMTDEKRFVRHEKLFFWMIKGFLAISAIIFGIILLQSGTFTILTDNLLAGVSLAAVLLLLGLALIMGDQSNQENIENRDKIANLIFKANDDLGLFASKSYISRLMKSKWFWTIDDQYRWEIADKIIETSFSLFPSKPKERLAFIDTMASTDVYPPVDTIWKVREKIYEFASNNKEIWAIVDLMIEGKKFEVAASIIHSQRSAWERKKSQMARILANIALPFVVIWFGLVWLWTKIHRFFWMLKNIILLFNKMCPFTYKPKLLN